MEFYVQQPRAAWRRGGLTKMQPRCSAARQFLINTNYEHEGLVGPGLAVIATVRDGRFRASARREGAQVCTTAARRLGTSCLDGLA